MLFRHLYDSKLAQGSYLLACQRTGEAIVVDPNRDADRYLAAARAEGVRVTHVTETHIHADFVSGARELAARAGAQLLLSDAGGSAWRYGYAAEAGARLVRDGDRFLVGSIAFDVLHTPGHTPEHITLLVTDTTATAEPMGALTGDFVFVGDVGRPDLLEKAAGVAGSMDASARELYASLQRFKRRPDHLQLWPGHGAGSACGKSLGAVPASTLGYEKLVNWGLTAASKAEFVAAVAAGQPEPPRYFAEMKRVNQAGPRLLGALPRPERLPAAALPEVIAAGGLVVDTRPPAQFAAGHVPGTINIPLNKSFPTWAGWLVPYDRDFHLIVDDACAGCADEAARDLALVGLDRLAGAFVWGACAAWAAEHGRALDTTPQIDVAGAAARLSGPPPLLLDVRARAEWDAGHIPGSRNVPVGDVTQAMQDVPRDVPILVHCQGGTRSAIAASLLRRAGFGDVTNMDAGYAGWTRAGLATEGGPVGDAPGAAAPSR